MEHEHKPHERMIDNRMVERSGKGGIARVMQRKGDLVMGKNAKLSEMPEEKSEFRREDMGTTPRRA